MNKQDFDLLIEKLTACSYAINQLVEHLAQVMPNNGENTAENTDKNTDNNIADNSGEIISAENTLDDTNIPQKADNTSTQATNMPSQNTNSLDIEVELDITAPKLSPVIDVAPESSAQTASTGSANDSTNQVKASAANPFARLFAGLNQSSGIPNNANPFNLLNMLAGGKGGMPNLPGLGNLGGLNNLAGLGGLNGGSLPSTLAELHDNPQIMNILNQVAANPQSLNMLSGLTGQSPEALQTALRSLQATDATTVTPAISANMPAPTLPPINTAMQGALPSAMPSGVSAAMPAAQMAVTPQTAHLDTLLTEWHWAPYARVWLR